MCTLMEFCILYVETTEVLSPPPYPSRLPSYEEILRLPSPMPLHTRQVGRVIENRHSKLHVYIAM